MQAAHAIPGSGYFVNSTAIYIKWNHGDRIGALADAEAILAARRICRTAAACL
jgi:hypothetical protein